MTDSSLLRLISFGAGVVIVIATMMSVLRTVVVPRLLPSTITSAVERIVVMTFVGLARLRPTYRWRDGIRAWTGPVSMLASLIVWLLLFVLGYGLMLYGISRTSMAQAVRQAGSSMLTLGFAASLSDNQTAVDFLAAATGPIVIAMMIGLLPTVYSAYVDREVEVTMLAARAGEPAWGPEILCRTALMGSTDELPGLYASWERWAANLRLTHTTYPVLLQVRGPGPTRHWGVALLAIMDAAALHVAVSRPPYPPTAMTLLLQGGQTMDVLFTVLTGSTRGGRAARVPKAPASGRAGLPAVQAPRRLAPSNRRAVVFAATEDTLRAMTVHQDAGILSTHPAPATLTRAEFDDALELLRHSGFPIQRPVEETWARFQLQRARYEPQAYAINRILDTVPAPWSGPRSPSLPAYWPTRAAELAPDPGAGPDDQDDADGTRGRTEGSL